MKQHSQHSSTHCAKRLPQPSSTDCAKQHSTTPSSTHTKCNEVNQAPLVLRVQHAPTVRQPSNTVHSTNTFKLFRGHTARCSEATWHCTHEAKRALKGDQHTLCMISVISVNGLHELFLFWGVATCVTCMYVCKATFHNLPAHTVRSSIPQPSTRSRGHTTHAILKGPPFAPLTPYDFSHWLHVL